MAHTGDDAGVGAQEDGAGEYPQEAPKRLRRRDQAAVGAAILAAESRASEGRNCARCWWGTPVAYSPAGIELVRCRSTNDTHQAHWGCDDWEKRL